MSLRRTCTPSRLNVVPVIDLRLQDPADRFLGQFITSFVRLGKTSQHRHAAMSKHECLKFRSSTSQMNMRMTLSYTTMAVSRTSQYQARKGGLVLAKSSVSLPR
ncbi:hypothetical protein M3J09_009381 [Ascochyta lentis]